MKHSVEAPPTQEPAPTQAKERRVRSEELLAGAQVLIIEHGSDCYRLRCTRSGKLILTK